MPKAERRADTRRRHPERRQTDTVPDIRIHREHAARPGQGAQGRLGTGPRRSSRSSTWSARVHRGRDQRHRGVHAQRRATAG
ncbi:MAG: hypothetical protein MZW92_63115 [Comamonadaceae bacterium]|nr:hypothetical protein [Comamonadaceae bacterium]